ncbi:MAG: DUF5050 domain-containing protein [Planctomycetes bacterium]|nr:DUF5050 domain-containing protein [Planctomycetota bacterium]
MGASAPEPQLVSNGRLDSWKEIAAHLGRGTRTVQRWEREQGMPVHRLRLAGQKQGSVYAYKTELDAWWRQRGSALEGEAPAASDQPSAPRRWLWPALLAGAAIVAGFFAWRLLGPRSSPAAPLRVVPLTSYAGLESYPAFSPDGKQVAFSWVGQSQDNTDIYVKLIGSDAPLRLTTDPADDIQPVWSPDGRHIAFLRTRWSATDEVRLLPAPGGPERRLAEIHTPQTDIPRPFLAWTPDGRWLIVPERPSLADPHVLALLSVAGGEKRFLTRPPSQSLGDSAPAISPDGRTLAFIRCTTIAVCDIYLMDLQPDWSARGEPRRLTSESTQVYSPMWAVGGRDLLYVRVMGDTPSLRRVPVAGSKPSQAVPSLGSLGLHAAISPQGDRLAYSSFTTDRDVYRVELSPDGGAGPPVKLISSTRSDQCPVYSPDGRRIAFFSDRAGNPEIWLASADGSHQSQLTSFGGPVVTSPNWSPDGRQIVFDVALGNTAEIYAIAADGGQPRRLTTDPANDRLPSFSRDGRWIYFASDRTGEQQVWKMPAAGGPAVQVTRRGGYGAYESSDGKTLYYAKSYSYGSTGLWRVPVEGGEETPLGDWLVSAYNFTVAGDGVYFVQTKEPQGGFPIGMWRPSTGRVERLATIPKLVAPGLTVWPPDRPRHLLYAVREPAAGDLMMVENLR